jgi:hypothetical protein
MTGSFLVLGIIFFMTKKELKEAICKICDIIDGASQDSEEYKRALKELKELQKKIGVKKIIDCSYTNH